MTSRHSKPPHWDEVWDKVEDRDHDWLINYIKSYDINEYSELLHCAVHWENLRAIVYLSHFFTDPNIEGAAGQTALQLAQDTRPRCLEYLHEHHLCIDFDKASTKPNGLDALFVAIYRGDATLGDTSGVKNNGNEKNPGRWTALHCAVMYDRPHLIRALHQRFPKLNMNSCNQNGYSALCLAALRGHSNCIIALCECFPAIKARDALHVACEYNHPACIPTLHQCFPQLTGNELAHDYNYPSVLMHAVSHNNPECIRALHSCFPDIDPNLQDKYGNTALIIAMQYSGRLDCIPVLFECFPNIDPNKQTNNGNTALMHACKQGLPQSITLFATYFPSIDVNVRNCQGETALMLVADEKCVLALCESFPNIDPHIQNGHGDTALMFAIFRQNAEPIISQLHKSFPDIDPNVQDTVGRTALMFAVNHYYPGLIISQLHKLFPNIDPNKQDMYQNTALMHLLQSPNCPVEYVRQFLDTFPNVDVNIRNAKGETALALTIEKDNAPVVDLLLERFPGLINSPGQTVLMLVIKNNSINLISILLKHIAQMQ